MARHARRHRPAPRGAWSFAGAHRWALSSALAVIAVAGACQVPLDYDRGFGATVTCEATGADAFAGDLARDLADRLQRRTGAHQVAVRLHAEDSGPSTLRIDLWGEEAALAGDDLLADIEGTNCSVEPLVETVHGTLGGRLGLELFDLELLDHDDAEAARAQIVERLGARGLHGDAEVEISDHGDGRREIKIRIKADTDAIAPE